MMFFTMLVMYSAFVLTSISTIYYVQDIARVFEYYVYFWGAGDFIEELISCFVSSVVLNNFKILIKLHCQLSRFGVYIMYEQKFKKMDIL